MPASLLRPRARFQRPAAGFFALADVRFAGEVDLHVLGPILQPLAGRTLQLHVLAARQDPAVGVSVAEGLRVDSCPGLTACVRVKVQLRT